MIKILKVLKFLNLLDDSGCLSITNLAVIIAIIKMASSHVAPVDAGALFASLLNYAHKRYTNAQGESSAKTGQDSSQSSNPSP